MITTIFFDIGGVLINIHPERTLQYLSDCTDVSVEEVRKCFPMEAHNQYEEGNLTDKEWFLAIKESLPQPCCLKESDFWHAWKLLLGDEKETVKILKELSDNYSIWLLSNTNPKHIRDEIEKRYTFPNLVSGSVYSFNVGLRKPHKEIFLTAADLAGTKPAFHPSPVPASALLPLSRPASGHRTDSSGPGHANHRHIFPLAGLTLKHR